MNLKCVVGIAGEPHSGKNSFAKALKAELCLGPGALDAVVYNISDGIAAVARAMGAMHMRNRNIICRVGDLYEERHPEVWTFVVEGKIIDDNSEVAIITGLRFLRQLRWLRQFKCHHEMVITHRYNYVIPAEDQKYKEILNQPNLRDVTRISAANLVDLQNCAKIFATALKRTLGDPKTYLPPLNYD